MIHWLLALAYLVMAVTMAWNLTADVAKLLHRHVAVPLWVHAGSLCGMLWFFVYVVRIAWRRFTQP